MAQNDPPDTPGGRIRWARELCGISAREVDRIVGGNVGHLALIETRIHERAELGTIAPYARALGLDLDWIWDGAGEVPTAASVAKAIDLARSTSTSLPPTGTEA